MITNIIVRLIFLNACEYEYMNNMMIMVNDAAVVYMYIKG